MISSGVELINIEHNIDYSPTFISTDKRNGGGTTSIGYWQIGATQQHGFAYGPVFRLEFVNVIGASAGGHIKIWGIDNQDDDAPIYREAYFDTTYKSPIIDVYLKKFIFCDASGNISAPTNPYTIVGYKKRKLPLAW